MITGSAYSYRLIKDYGAHLWLVYGMTPMTLGISMLCHSDQTVLSFYESYPLAMDRYLKEASLVICCVQLGFLMYYLYSRNLVTKSTVQTICKTYHITMGILFLLRVTRDLLVYFLEIPSNATGGIIPRPMLIQPMLLTALFSFKLLKLVATKKKEKHVPALLASNPNKTVAPLIPKRGSSSKTKRRSSLGARIEFSCTSSRR